MLRYQLFHKVLPIEGEIHVTDSIIGIPTGFLSYCDPLIQQLVLKYMSEIEIGEEKSIFDSIDDTIDMLMVTHDLKLGEFKLKK